ncbi:MAG: efflux RND transporter permease subunit [Dehalococcoidia bacterium]|nr:efflux RND transporter permease subunit [Dehalococcoidia bacterium]
MWHLTKFAVQNRILVFLVAVLLLITSVWALFSMKTEMIPDIQFPYLTIITVYPEASPDVVASNVSTPIEKVISERWDGHGLKSVTSTSANNVSVIEAEFAFGTNMDKVTQAIRQSISQLDFPPEVLNYARENSGVNENPRVIPIDMSIMPLVVFSLSGDFPPDKLKEIADSRIVPQMKAVKGIISAETEGGEKEQVIIVPDPAKLSQFGISLSQIVDHLGLAYDSLGQIENAAMGTDGATLKDVAAVGLGPGPMTVLTRSASSSSETSKPSVVIQVLKKDSANTVDVANAVVARAEEINNLDSGVELTVLFDQSDYIEKSISQLEEKAIIGGVLAIAVVFLFLMAVRASLVTAISIPSSVFIGFLAMYAFGITINIMTLSAMSIAVGRLIDDSIVIVEIIYRRLQRGEVFRDAAIGGAKEVATPITSATLATVAIFLPLMFVGGIVGELFIPFALTVTFAMIASLLVALMLVPALSNLLVGDRTQTKREVTWYQRGYVRVLGWALAHRARVLIIVIVLFLSSGGLVSMIGTSFMSGMGDKALTANIQMPAGTDIKVTSQKAAEVEALLADNPQIKKFATTVGTSTSLWGAMSTASGGGNNTAEISIYLKSGANLTREADNLRDACQKITGDAKIAITTSESDSGMGSGLDISIQGENYEDIAATAKELTSRIEGIKGLENVEANVAQVVPKLDIELDPARAQALGMATERLQEEFDLLMMGGVLPDKSATINGETYQISVRGVSDRLSGDLEQIKALPIGWPQSASLGDVASVTLPERPTHVIHIDQVLAAKITGEITDKDVGAVNAKVKKQINKLADTPGVKVEMHGAAEDMEETFTRMVIAILAAIVISFMVVALIMRSILNPLIIMVSLPLASIGAMLALFITGHTISVSSLMGILMLVGIVLTNAIVLISLVEQLRMSGMNTHDALIEGGRTRLRPILMTAMTTIFAMMPLALGVSSGTMIAADLGVVVIGGMFSSTLLTLIVIPVVYSLTDRFRRGPKSARSV